MLKVVYDAYDLNGYCVEYTGEAILPDIIEIPKNKRQFIKDFIVNWKGYKHILLYYYFEISEKQYEKDKNFCKYPSEYEIRKTLSLMEKDDGMEKYGIYENICPLCERNMPDKEKSKHHLIPASEGGKHTKTVVIHRMCHQKIHSVFTEEEMALKYNSIEKLLEHEEVIKFISWIKKKPDDYYDVSRQNKLKRDKKYKSDLE